MDGALDGAATLIAENNGNVLYAGVIGHTLYVATWDAGEGNDNLLFVADMPGTMRAAPWAKAGTAANWSAYLANENDNLWAGWFDQAGATQLGPCSGTGYLEGTINLVDEFGAMPSVVYLAAVPYETPDGGALVAAYQVPASINSDGNLDAGEYAQVDICDITVPQPPTQYTEFAACLAGPGQPIAPTCPCSVDADYDNDGDVDLHDFAEFAAD